MDDASKEAIDFAEKLATDIMTVGGPPPNPRADHLQLMRKGKSLGGWSFNAIQAKIAAAYDNAMDEKK